VVEELLVELRVGQWKRRTILPVRDVSRLDSINTTQISLSNMYYVFSTPACQEPYIGDSRKNT